MTLGRGEAAIEHGVRIFRSVQHRLLGRFAFGRRPAALPEVRLDMDVRVDQTRQECELRKVVRDASLCRLSNALDLSCLHDHGGIPLHSPFTINERSCSNDDRLLRRQRCRCREQQRGDRQPRAKLMTQPPANDSRAIFPMQNPPSTVPTEGPCSIEHIRTFPIDDVGGLSETIH